MRYYVGRLVKDSDRAVKDELLIDLSKLDSDGSQGQRETYFPTSSKGINSSKSTSSNTTSSKPTNKRKLEDDDEDDDESNTMKKKKT